MRYFRDKVVVVTGASSGIGEALAYEFAREGARVVVAARGTEKLAAIADRIEAGVAGMADVAGGDRASGGMIADRIVAGVAGAASMAGMADGVASAVAAGYGAGVPSAGRITAADRVEDGRGFTEGAAAATRGEEGCAAAADRVLVVSCDVSREDECKRLIDTAVEKFGGIDVLVCNAGVSMRAVLDDVSPEVLRRLMDVNFWGTVYCVKYALPWLQASKGSITGVSSVAGLHGLPGRTGYSASKYAMTGFLETVRVENLHKGVHVMIACPGFTATNVRLAALTADGSPQGSTPREEGKMMTAEEVAGRIIKGIRRRKRLLLMEWEGRATHFIKKFAPRLLDRLFYNAMAREPDSPLR
jgi:NAD(P)-dependent dehydrogenase (short-subunit alcohol dehydrogenase family)